MHGTIFFLYEIHHVIHKTPASTPVSHGFPISFPTHDSRSLNPFGSVLVTELTPASA